MHVSRGVADLQHEHAEVRLEQVEGLPDAAQRIAAGGGLYRLLAASDGSLAVNRLQYRVRHESAFPIPM